MYRIQACGNRCGNHVEVTNRKRAKCTFLGGGGGMQIKIPFSSMCGKGEL